MLNRSRRKQRDPKVYKKNILLRASFGDFDGNVKVRDAMIELVAGTWGRQKADSKNCVTLEGPEKETHCNIGNVAFARASGGQGVNAKLNVWLEAEMPSEFGKFDCIAIKESVNEYMKVRTAPRLGDAFGLPWFDTFVTCRFP